MGGPGGRLARGLMRRRPRQARGRGRLAQDFVESVAEEELKEQLGVDPPTNPKSLGGVAGTGFHKMFLSRAGSSPMSDSMLQHRATTRGMSGSAVKDAMNGGKLNPLDTLLMQNGRSGRSAKPLDE